jgi:3-hydroxyisobutyrate dehydrogenase-like beta-hydroxyacid dehydrogenase
MGAAEPLAVVGLGSMGLAAAEHLRDLGHTVYGYDPSATACDRAARAGVVVLADPAEVGRAVEVVYLAVPDGEAVFSAVDGLARAGRRPLAILDMSTLSPAAARAARERARALGCRYIETPVARAVRAARTGDLLAMVACPEEELIEVRPWVERIASDVVWAGPPGSGQTLKAIHNLKILGEVALIAESVALARAHGVPEASLEQVLRTGSSRSFMVDYQLGRMLGGDYAPGFRIVLAEKDLAIALSMADDVGLHLEVTEAALASYAGAERGGWGQMDTAALVSYLGRAAPQSPDGKSPRGDRTTHSPKKG